MVRLPFPPHCFGPINLVSSRKQEVRGSTRVSRMARRRKITHTVTFWQIDRQWPLRSHLIFRQGGCCQTAAAAILISKMHNNSKGIINIMAGCTTRDVTIVVFLFYDCACAAERVFRELVPVWFCSRVDGPLLTAYLLFL